MSTRDLVSLVGELYRLDARNRAFIEARFASPQDRVAPFRHRVQTALYPDPLRDARIRTAEGKKAISDYRKSTGDLLGTIDLMILFVEAGTQSVSDYGGMDDKLYDSFTTMYLKVLELLSLVDHEQALEFLPRLAAIIDSADGIGWWYQETLQEAFDGAFAGHTGA